MGDDRSAPDGASFLPEEALRVTDPEFARYFGDFVRDVAGHGSLDEHTTWLVRLAALIGCQGHTAHRHALGQALDRGITPTEAKEVVYQAVPYLGLGRVMDFLRATNEVLAERGVELPLPPQSTTTPETRRPEGWQAQATIFGEEHIQKLHDSATDENRHIQEWLTANCFGDNYTRSGLTLQTRELLTFVLLVSQGGAEPQARSHAAGNAAVGNGRQVLLDVCAQLVPLIGYPRTLNALAVVNGALPTG